MEESNTDRKDKALQRSTHKNISSHIQNITKELSEIVSSEAKEKLLSAESMFESRKIKTGKVHIDDSFRNVIESIKSLIEEAEELLKLPSDKVLSDSKDIFDKHNKKTKEVRSALKIYKDALFTYEKNPFTRSCQGTCKTHSGILCSNQKKEVISACSDAVKGLEDTFVKSDANLKVFGNDLKTYMDEIVSEIKNYKLVKTLNNHLGRIEVDENNSFIEILEEETKIPYIEQRVAYLRENSIAIQSFKKYISSLNDEIGSFINDRNKNEKGGFTILWNGSKILKRLQELEGKYTVYYDSLKNCNNFFGSILTHFKVDLDKLSETLLQENDTICALFTESERYINSLKHKKNLSYNIIRKIFREILLANNLILRNKLEFINELPNEADINIIIQTDVYKLLVLKHLLDNPRYLESTESHHGSSLGRARFADYIPERSTDFPLLRKTKSMSYISEEIDNSEILKTMKFHGIVDGITDSKVSKKDYFLILFCIISLGLMAFLGITKRVGTSETIVGITRKVAYTISILGPILHGIWILTNENYSGGIVEVVSKNWNVIGSMFPMLLGLKKDSLRKISEEKASIESYGVMVAMSVIMICSQTFLKGDKKIHGRQMSVFVIGNVLMGIVYVNSLLALSTGSGHNLVPFGYIIFGLILCFMVIIEGGDRMRNSKSEGMEWMVIFQWIMSWMFVIFGFQNFELPYFHYARNTI